MVHLDKPKLVPLILALIQQEGKAKFDFGTFRVVERKNGVIRLLTTGKTKKVGAYKAIFFRASDTLRKGLHKIKTK
jgi:nucleoid DNA-binding protein